MKIQNSRHDVQNTKLLQQQNKQTDADNFSQQKNEKKIKIFSPEKYFYLLKNIYIYRKIVIFSSIFSSHGVN